MRQLVMLIVLFVAPVTLASQPGQPLDCSDWVLVEPGISCVLAVPDCSHDMPGATGASPQCLVSRNPRALSNDGRVFRVVQTQMPSAACNGLVIRRLELQAFSGDHMRVLAYVDERCNSDWPDVDELYGFETILDVDNEGWRSLPIAFDAARGVLSFAIRSSYRCHTQPPANCIGGADYDRLSLYEFHGFSSLFDLFESFNAVTGAFGFSVALVPEGLRAADHFDTYWGSVTPSLDLAMAHPLQCAYPSAPPHVGDYFQITAPVPTPAPGNANYILTSVTYQGQTRAGRKAGGGRLTGRDASRLPACVE